MTSTNTKDGQLAALSDHVGHSAKVARRIIFPTPSEAAHDHRRGAEGLDRLQAKLLKWNDQTPLPRRGFKSSLNPAMRYRPVLVINLPIQNRDKKVHRQPSGVTPADPSSP